MSQPSSAYQRAVHLLQEHLEAMEAYESDAEFDAAVLVAALQQNPEVTRALLDGDSSNVQEWGAGDLGDDPWKVEAR
jgi:hypothetical protein